MKNDPLEPTGAVMCSSSSGPHCHFITGKHDSAPSVLRAHAGGLNIVQMTRSSEKGFWSTVNGVNPHDFVTELTRLLASMVPSSQEDRMENAKLSSTIQSSVQSGEHHCDSNDWHVDQEKLNPRTANGFNRLALCQVLLCKAYLCVCD